MAAESVLIVDDDESIRQIVRLVLSDEGYEVFEAPNGEVALEIVKRSRPSLILLDLRMPVMDGWEFARLYAEQPEPRAPIVAFVAALNAEEDCEGIGASGILTKPFDLDDLLQAVRSQIPLAT